MAALSFTQRTEFDAYVHNEQHTVNVLVTLKTASIEEDVNRSEICLSASLDRSGSMHGQKIKLVKRTMYFIARQMTANDKFGVVTYESNVISCVFYIAVRKSCR